MHSLNEQQTSSNLFGAQDRERESSCISSDHDPVIANNQYLRRMNEKKARKAKLAEGRSGVSIIDTNPNFCELR